jgi:hypothetical protein
MWGGDYSTMLFNSFVEAEAYIINGINKDSKKCGVLRDEKGNGQYRAWLKNVQKTNPTKVTVHQGSTAIFYGKLIGI